MVTPDDPSIGVRKAPDLPSVVLPLQRGNVKFLSFGHVNPKALAGAVFLFFCLSLSLFTLLSSLPCRVGKLLQFSEVQLRPVSSPN
jgi:hypothetical protein